jgi:hypothetical protein
VEVFWRAPLGNGFNLLRVHGHTIPSDNQSQVGNLLLVKLAFVRPKMQSHLSQFLKHSTDMYLMFSHGIVIDQDVAKVGRNKVVEERSKDIVDKMLECRRGFGESKGHDKRFEKAITGAESRLPFLPFSHADQVVGMSDVKGSVVTGFGQAVQGFSYEGEGVAILDCPVIGSSIVDTES